jgi:alpha-L-fucosidase 2
MPLGNGLLGALVWGDGRPLRISLDRTDLWDLRPVPEFESPDYSYKTMQQWVKEGRIEDLHRLYDVPYRERALEIFSRAFCLRNGFHCNGDQSGQGYSSFRYRPFTLEGNFAAAAGIQEMLLQSYSGTIRMFPAIPAKWREASFRGLRAEGAFVVSAARKNGRTEVVQVLSEAGGVLSLENPFGGSEYSLTGAEPGSLKTKGQELLLDTRPGQTVTFATSTKRIQ